MCHQHEHGRHFAFEITFGGFNAMSTVFQIYKGDISLNCTSRAIAGAREMCLAQLNS